MTVLRRLFLLLLTTVAAADLIPRAAAQEVAPEGGAKAQPAEAAKPAVPIRQRRATILNGRPPDMAPQRPEPSVEELLGRLETVQRSAAATETALGGKAAPAAPAESAVRLVPENLHLGKVYLEAKHVRYVAMRLWLINTTGKPVTIPRESIRLIARGNEIEPNQMPPRQGLPHISFGDHLVPVRELERSGPVTVPANGATSLPVAFFALPGTTDVPEMTLRVPLGEDRVELDLNHYALGLMDLSIEQLGPGGLLGVVTMNGELTPVGAGGLADVIQKLTNAQATRIVLAWSDAAPPPPAELSNWLVQSATRVGMTALNDGQHPVLSPSLLELHLASIPEGTGVPNYPGPRRVHDTNDAAITAALEGAYDSIPLDVLLKEIETGHPKTRPAAVAAGSRLPDERLLLKLTADADPAIAAAATHALRGHGTPAAIGRLVDLAKTGPEPLRAEAVESLAASRYGVAHEALRELLDASANGAPVIPPAALVPVLAEHPRPLWSDALFRMATQGEPAVRGDALAALAGLGHPRLIDAFRAAIGSPDESLQLRAFSLIAWRQDDESARLATDYLLSYLESKPPTREMELLLTRTKEPRAVPLLLKHIDRGGPQRPGLVRLLVQVGGLEVRDDLADIYPKLDRATQPLVLAALAEMQSPRFIEFAAAALHGNDPALVSAAVQQLQADGGPEAVTLLTDIFFETEQPTLLAYVANGLGGIGTQEARQALRKASITPGPRRDAAAQAWWNLQRQSAGWEFFMAGLAAKKREDWKAASERFSEAIDVDPDFIDAWTGRASARMQLQDYAAARHDYERALALDPYDSAPVTCLGILRVFDGQVEEGLAFVRDRSAPFARNELFAYNTACLYAVASDRLVQSDPARAEQLRADAVRELARSIELGMTAPDDVAWIRKDPDLTSLRGRPDFEKVVTAIEAKIRSAGIDEEEE